MISIERHGARYKVRVKDEGMGSYSEPAATLTEAANAVLHYYGSEHERAACAFCHASRRAGEKKQRRERA